MVNISLSDKKHDRHQNIKVDPIISNLWEPIIITEGGFDQVLQAPLTAVGLWKLQMLHY